MEFLVIDYRHPVFSIVMLLLLVAAVALANHWWGVLRRRDQERKLSRFLSRFEAEKRAKDYKDVLKVQPDSVDSLLLLASIYYKSGEYNEAMRIYLALLDILAEKSIRVDVMTLLGRTYHKAGFFQRSRDILLESLKIKARNPEALELLLVIYEQMREYAKALEVLEALEELDRNVQKERAFVMASHAVHNAALSDEKKEQALLQLWEQYPFLSRQVLEFLFAHNPQAAWRHVNNERARLVADLFWYLPKEKFDENEALKHPFLAELYSAKGWVNATQKSAIFELDILIQLGSKRSIATLEFEHLCGRCLATYPLYFHRCPNCFAVGSARTEPVLAQNTGGDLEVSASFH
ncbi:MAG: tetratricopeptide repeat protein [Campylobacterales bacterium]